MLGNHYNCFFIEVDKLEAFHLIKSSTPSNLFLEFSFIDIETKGTKGDILGNFQTLLSTKAFQYYIEQSFYLK